MDQHPPDQQSRQVADAPAGRSPLSNVVVHGSDVSVQRAHSEVPLAEARSRFGGVDVPAAIGGALAGLGTAALLGGLATALGLEAGSVDVDTDALAIGGLITTVVLLGLSALVAGWVAGRVARYDGARNGLLAGLLMALLLALLGAAGAYSAADGGLPVSLDGDRLTTAAIVAAVIGLVVSALAGLLGGKLGARWHRDVDDVLVGTRPGGVAPLLDGSSHSTSTGRVDGGLGGGVTR
jgi:hypothetical protein